MLALFQLFCLSNTIFKVLSLNQEALPVFIFFLYQVKRGSCIFLFNRAVHNLFPSQCKHITRLHWMFFSISNYRLAHFFSIFKRNVLMLNTYPVCVFELRR